MPIAEEPDEEVDESGVEPKDIELVMSQAGCSRVKAVMVETLSMVYEFDKIVNFDRDYDSFRQTVILYYLY
jgi:hypothetical protein